MAGFDPQRKAIRQIIERDGLVGLLNDTKWRELLDLIVPLHPEVRVKLITSDEASSWTKLARVPTHYIEPVEVGPVLCMEVEWIEMKCPSEPETAVIRRILDDLRLGYNLTTDAIHLQAYHRPQ